MKRSARRLAQVALGGVILTSTAGLFAHPASAHPLGNLSVNHFHGLELQTNLLIDDAVVDTAEIPTAQLQGSVDTDGNGTATPEELAHYGRAQCDELRASVTLTIDRQATEFTVASTSFAYRAGQAGLPTGRLECRLEAVVDLTSPRSVDFSDSFLDDRIGWHEIIATAVGVTLVDPTVASVSVTGRLEHYPVDLLSSPLDQRQVTLQVKPGSGPGGTAGTAPKRQLSVDAFGPFSRVVNRIDRSFNSLVGRRQLTLGVGMLAIALALLLGASHALLPGHGKTVMAAYIAGRQGSVRDAVLVGATVTATHTGGVLLLGLALTISTSLAGEVVLGWLGVASGLLIAALGVSLLTGSRRRAALTGDRHSHGPGEHSHGRGGHVPSISSHRNQNDAHPHDHDHSHDDDNAHDHPHEHDDAHEHGTRTPVSRRGLLGMGVAGGLVPSPSALVVLLSAIALGRTAFGVLLVIAYGVGMAGTLTLAGMLLVRVRDRYQKRSGERLGKAQRVAKVWTRIAPFATATLVVIVGVGLALRSIALV